MKRKKSESSAKAKTAKAKKPTRTKSKPAATPRRKAAAKEIPAAPAKPAASETAKKRKTGRGEMKKVVKRVRAVARAGSKNVQSPSHENERTVIAARQENSGKSEVRPAARSRPAATVVSREREAALSAKVQELYARGRTEAASPTGAEPVSGSKPRKSSTRTPLTIPPILLEGDEPATLPATGPGRRYALGPEPATAHFTPETAALPESYGTGKVYLTARDPHWLYAHWDFTAAQLKSYNALAPDGHQALRLHADSPSSAPLTEIQLHPESRHWFVPAPQAGAKYAVTLGYYDSAGRWMETGQSGATLTPPDTMAEEVKVQFTSIPVDVPLEQIVETVQAVVRESKPLADAVKEMQPEVFAGLRNIVGLPEFVSLPEPEEIPAPWTPEQEKALAAMITVDAVRQVWVGPIEVTEIIRRQLEQTASSIAAAQFGQPGAEGLPGDARPGFPLAALGAITSPSPAPLEVGKGRNFWFNVNAELIVYGSTEQDARVEIGGRPITLRRDGSFSFRFALPDGDYSLPVVAASADGEETRQADLNFSRSSEYSSGVGAHPQDALLQAPSANAVVQ